MPLNLLDSLGSAAASPEKNSFSLKSQSEPGNAGHDFGHVLGGVMDRGQDKQGPVTNEASARTSGQDKSKNSEDDRHQTEASRMEGSDTPAVPQQPALTTLVLSPNMTAITRKQSPDAGGLAAFAKSQGLDADVAAWLMASGKGVSDLHSASKSAPSDTNPDGTSPLLQFMPMNLPASWLTPRSAVAGKNPSATITLLQTGKEKEGPHISDLDLSQVFGSGKDPSPASGQVMFTPAAWAMAGVMGNAVQSNSVEHASGLLKSLTDDPASDEGGATVNGLGGNPAERSPGKLSDPLSTSAASSAKNAESSMTAAQRSELNHAQAEKMGQAIGQRMLSELEKGHWHLKMMLRPANLGSIEVEMRLRNGELDANFTASQANTRDLLQDGMSKLKETLTHMGMDVASMNVGGGSSQKNGGDPTAQRTPGAPAHAQKDHREEQTMTVTQQVSTSGQDGLDVLV